MVDIAGHRSLNNLLDFRASQAPGGLAAVIDDGDGAVVRATFEELALRSSRLAGGLRELGVGHGDRVLVHLPNSLEFLFTWFAAARLGAVVVPSNLGNVERELRHVIDHADVTVAVTSSDFYDLFARCGERRWDGGRVILTDRAVDGASSFEELSTGDPPPVAQVRDDDLVELLFTSGSTAMPKAVMITHANCLRSGEQIAKSLCLTPEDRCLSALPLFHANAQSNTVLPSMTVGATFVLLQRFSASRYLEQLATHDATITSLVGTQVRTLLAQSSSPYDRAHRVRHVKFALNVSDGDRQRFEERFGMQLLNGYGLSEAMTSVTMAPIFGDHRWPSVGLPLIDRDIAVVDEKGSPVPAGEVGEIVVRGVAGHTVMLGYWRDPDATKAVLHDGYLFTGDLGRLDSFGYLHFVDRATDVIKRAGENISATEVESVLRGVSGISDVAVVGFLDPVRDRAVAAFVVLEQSGKPSKDEIFEHCRKHLAPFKVPTVIEFRSELPKSSVGKVLKRELTEDLNKAGDQP